MNSTTSMAIVTAPGKIEFQEKALPELKAHDVLIRVKAAAICGSDLHIYRGLHPSAPLPVAIGHELSGEIMEVGRDVTMHHPGDRVTVEPVITCGLCEFCLRGQYNLCTQISFQYRRGQGAFTSHYVVNERHAFRLPEQLSFEEGALIEPLAVALRAVKKSNIGLAKTCAVFGAGAIGLLVARLCSHVSGSSLFVSDINEFRLMKAREMGATDLIHAGETDPIQYILKKTGQIGVDNTFEAVGIEPTILQALKSLRKGGTCTLLGIFEQPNVDVPLNLFIQKEITLTGSQGYCWDFQDALRLLDNRMVDLGTMVTHRLRLSDLQDGFEILMDPRKKAIKVVVIFN